MKCNSCGARSDPTRSFCRRCGSAVFVEENVYASMRAAAAAAISSISPPDHAVQPDAVSGPSNPVPRVARAAKQAARRVRTQQPQAAAVAGAGCLGSLVRTAVFLGFAYFMLNGLGVWPAVRQAATAVANGEQVDVSGFVNQLRALIDLPPLDNPEGASPRQTEPDAAQEPRPTPQAAAPEPAESVASSAPVIPARVVRRVQPLYPAEAFEKGIQGVVQVSVIVEPDGTVSYASVLQSVEGLDAAALAAARQWRFEAAQQGGMRIKSQATIALTFRKG